MLKAEQFYDALADDYDAMTSFQDRLATQRGVLTTLLEQLPATQVVDMGCGTGVHAIALAQLGLAVTAVDISGGMLEKARRHAADASVSLRFLHGDFLTPIGETPADLLLCLGNSLPHLPSLTALTDILKHWRTLLTNEGHVVIQLLNYKRIIREGKRIVNIRRDGDRLLVRFYDFMEQQLRFNILAIQEENGAFTHELRSTLLTAFTEQNIIEAAFEAGFGSVHSYGSLLLTPFTGKETDLVLLLH
ncbi:MAG: methyltransferase domain-containing protein [Bacteroidetes bacterium]|nr:methyltransferase domain-containing protein [Bacteroidota bacterium]